MDRCRKKRRARASRYIKYARRRRRLNKLKIDYRERGRKSFLNLRARADSSKPWSLPSCDRVNNGHVNHNFGRQVGGKTYDIIGIIDSGRRSEYSYGVGTTAACALKYVKRSVIFRTSRERSYTNIKIKKKTPVKITARQKRVATRNGKIAIGMTNRFITTKRIYAYRWETKRPCSIRKTNKSERRRNVQLRSSRPSILAISRVRVVRQHRETHRPVLWFAVEYNYPARLFLFTRPRSFLFSYWQRPKEQSAIIHYGPTLYRQCAVIMAR